MLGRLLNRRARRKQAERLHEDIIAQSRQPLFYAQLGVPDTMLGRYEMVCLHAYLVLTRLNRESEEGHQLAQTLHNLIFDDFDVALREAGLGDMGVGKRIKKLARNLHGRISVYEAGLASDDEELEAILRRNMYASVEPDASQVAGMIAYIKAARQEMDACSGEAMFAGNPAFPDTDAIAPDAPESVTA